jgi:hypothetical protein
MKRRTVKIYKGGLGSGCLGLGKQNPKPYTQNPNPIKMRMPGEMQIEVPVNKVMGIIRKGWNWIRTKFRK